MGDLRLLPSGGCASIHPARGCELGDRTDRVWTESGSDTSRARVRVGSESLSLRGSYTLRYIPREGASWEHMVLNACGVIPDTSRARVRVGRLFFSLLLHHIEDTSRARVRVGSLVWLAGRRGILIHPARGCELGGRTEGDHAEPIRDTSRARVRVGRLQFPHYFPSV